MSDVSGPVHPRTAEQITHFHPVLLLMPSTSLFAFTFLIAHYEILLMLASVQLSESKRGPYFIFGTPNPQGDQTSQFSQN